MKNTEKFINLKTLYYKEDDKYFRKYKQNDALEITKEDYLEAKEKKEFMESERLNNLKIISTVVGVTGAGFLVFLVLINGVYELQYNYTDGLKTMYSKWGGGKYIINQMNSHENNYYVHEKIVNNLVIPIAGYNLGITESITGFVPEGFVQINDNECMKEGDTTLQILSSELQIEGWENKGYYIPSEKDKAFYAISKEKEYISLDYEEEARKDLHILDGIWNREGIIDEKFLMNERIDSRNIELLIDKEYLYTPLGKQLTLNK